MREPTYYDILGVSRKADIKEIKAKYRDLAIKNHPDRVPAPEKNKATEKMAQINKAYEVLSDKESRARYDESLDYGVDYNQYKDYKDQSGTHTNFSDFFRNFGSGFGFFNDDGSFFYSSDGQAGDDHYAASATSKLHITKSIALTIQEIYCGTTKRISYKRQIVCPSCAKEFLRCSKCGGKGSTANFFLDKRCVACSGTGFTNSKNCAPCNNRRTVDKDTELTINIPEGSIDAVSYRGFGNEYGNQKGDLIVNISLIRDPIYNLDNQGNVYADINISILEAIEGAKVECIYLDGKKHILTIAPSLNSDVLKIPNMGLKRNYSRAALILNIKIIKPKLSKSEKEKIEEIIGVVQDKVFKRV